MFDPPQAVVMAGPNGSGKSTCARLLLPPEMRFINADMIAQELSGVPGTAADLRAGRVLLERLDDIEKNKVSFAVETTLATKKLVPRVKRLRGEGYESHLFFMYLPNDDLAVERVAARVRAGGHDVPEETVRRRFASGLKLFFEAYMPIFDSWRMYDNSKIEEPELIAHGRAGAPVCEVIPALWESICKRWRP